MNIAQRKQQERKNRMAAGEKVVLATPDYSKQKPSAGNAAQRFQKRILAKQVQVAASTPGTDANDALVKQYEIIKASLDGDLTTLKGLKTIKQKIEYKTHVIPNYLNYLQEYKSAGHHHPNGVLAQVLVWLFDTRQFDLAFEYADLALEQGQKLPPRFTTANMQTFICDELADYAAEQLKAKRPAPALNYAIEGLNNGWDVNKVPAAKVYAMAGKFAAAAGELENAFDYCTKALELNDRAGVKKLLNDITAKLAAKNEQTA